MLSFSDLKKMELVNQFFLRQKKMQLAINLKKRKEVAITIKNRKIVPLKKKEEFLRYRNGLSKRIIKKISKTGDNE